MQFIFEKIVPVQRKILFQFHSCPERLEVLHDGWSRTRLLKHEKRVRVGGETWVEQTIAGVLPVILGFRHIMFEPPSRFGEELIHGPFSKFHHIHEFEERKSETMVRDLVDVEWPWQYGGAVAMRLCVERGIRKMFEARGEAMMRLAQEGVVELMVARDQTPN